MQKLRVPGQSERTSAHLVVSGPLILVPCFVTQSVLPPISKANANRQRFTQDNFLLGVPPKKTLARLVSTVKPAVDESDVAELYNKEFAHSNRGR